MTITYPTDENVIFQPAPGPFFVFLAAVSSMLYNLVPHFAPKQNPRSDYCFRTQLIRKLLLYMSIVHICIQTVHEFLICYELV